MHVDNIQSPSLNLNSLRQSEVRSHSKWGNGHSAVLIKSDTNLDSSTFKLKNAAQSQFQAIDQRASSPLKTLDKPTNKHPPLYLTRDEQVEILENVHNLLEANSSNGLGVFVTENGKQIFKSVNHQDFKKDPPPKDAKFGVAIDRNGIKVILGHENGNLKIDEFHDENGQQREFQFLALEDDLYSQFQKTLEVHVNNFIEMKKTENLEKSKPRDELDNVRAILSDKVNKIKNQVIEVETSVRKHASKNVQELVDKVGLFFPTVQSLIIKKIEAERIKEKEGIELEKKNLEIIHKIEVKSIELFASSQKRIKEDHESEAIALSEQNHMRANRFKPIKQAKTTV